MRRLWHHYSLSLTLLGCFAVSLLAQGVFQVAMDGRSWTAFLASVFENWQSEFLQLLVQVVLPVYLIHRNSPASRDSDDALRSDVAALRQTQDDLKRMLQTAAMRDYELAAGAERRSKAIQKILDRIEANERQRNDSKDDAGR